MKNKVLIILPMVLFSCTDQYYDNVEVGEFSEQTPASEIVDEDYVEEIEE